MSFWELTNDQRQCFGIAPVDAGWRRIALPRSKYDDFDTVFYADGDHIRHVVCHGEYKHTEYAVDENLSPDGLCILPKRSSKPIKLSAATLVKRSPVGMGLSYHRYPLDEHGHVTLCNVTAMQDYYTSALSGDRIGDIEDFRRWVSWWCEQTTQADLADIAAFAGRTMKTVKHREGDVFRFRWNRKHWGYGRILLDWAKLRREKIPMWDCLMTKPVVIQLFQIVTEDPNLPLKTVLAQETIPAENLMDNALHYGEFEIIGNAPLPENRDELCPIMYGRTLDVRENRTLYQQGRIFREIPDRKTIGSQDYRNNGVSGVPHITMPEMLQIIREGEQTYWTQPYYTRKEDLRNPANAEDLAAIRHQMGV